jgi:serine/threonine protein kinase
VYKGILQEGQLIAVKQHKIASSQGDKEFCAEVEVLSCAQHRNLVTLIGYCVEDHLRLLVYEFVCNGSLDRHLSCKWSVNFTPILSGFLRFLLSSPRISAFMITQKWGGLPIMSFVQVTWLISTSIATAAKNKEVLLWKHRQKIALGAARGIRYLHEECRVGCIVHRDMRPNNILLTHDFTPMVGDFGLARRQFNGETAEETRVIGTFGYVTFVIRAWNLWGWAHSF